MTKHKTVFDVKTDNFYKFDRYHLLIVYIYDHAIILICIINVQYIKRAIDTSWDVKILNRPDMKHPTRKHQYTCILNFKKL